MRAIALLPRTPTHSRHHGSLSVWAELSAVPRSGVGVFIAWGDTERHLVRDCVWREERGCGSIQPDELSTP
eukprot:CAMPEP_0183344834 /NCGR_PEP_ID=MMETSP0164_2-20130417/10419_1 /TAXON_ID=221442 /ORGANISM="Coccolithus pelagicus ssp braarudi, Strain PLY182g" /LENGTH=70 /DNA_ID=CAMNT_0025515903 /DNA_START=40 /DNA_END=252 /DNA_ORIENTATION=-